MAQLIGGGSQNFVHPQLVCNLGRATAFHAHGEDALHDCSRFWINKKRAEEKVQSERRQVSRAANIGRSFDVFEVSRNAVPYIGSAVEWQGVVEFVSTRKGRRFLFVNSQPTVNADSNMDYSFEVEFPKDLPNDPRIALKSEVVVKGKILRVDKIRNINSGSFSSRRQPVIEASEIIFTRPNYDTPLTLQFF